MPEGSQETSRNWVLTLHLDGKTEEELLNKIEDYPEWIRYLRVGREICPTTGSIHYQGWCMCWSPVKFTKFQSWIGNRFRQPMYGNFAQNEAYCSKEGVYKDYGEPPMQGRRTDLIGTKRRLDVIKPGENIMDVANEEPHFGAIAKHSRFFQEYVANKRFRALQSNFEKPQVIYIYGPSECGKDHYVDTNYPGIYDCPLSRGGFVWKDGYNMQETVVYRNVHTRNIKENKYQFLKELDRRAIQVEVKGGFVPWKPKTILITSIQTPWEIAEVFDCSHEFFRRVTKFLGWHNGTKSFHEVRI